VTGTTNLTLSFKAIDSRHQLVWPYGCTWWWSLVGPKHVA
jgi:hypothetical protein